MNHLLAQSRWRGPLLAAIAALCTALPVLAAEDAHGGATPSLFTGDLGNAVWTLVIFLLVVFVLGKFAWKPLLGALQKREEFIRDSLKDAKRDREESERLLAEHRAQMNRARDEAAQIVEESRRAAEALRHKLEADAHREAEQIVTRAREEIGLARDAAVKEIFDVAAELATDAAGRILRKELSPADHSALVQQSIAELRKMREGGRN